MVKKLSFIIFKLFHYIYIHKKPQQMNSTSTLLWPTHKLVANAPRSIFNITKNYNPAYTFDKKSFQSFYCSVISCIIIFVMSALSLALRVNSRSMTRKLKKFRCQFPAAHHYTNRIVLYIPFAKAKVEQSLNTINVVKKKKVKSDSGTTINDGTYESPFIFSICCF